VPVDRGVVGEVAAKTMAELEERFGDREDANVRAVLLIVAVDHVEEGEDSTEVRWGVSEELARHEAIGLLEYVKPFLYG
jgi:hypothetical protein